MEQLRAFSVELTRWMHADAATPKTIEEMIGSGSLVVVGELVALTPGRKAFSGVGCENRDEQTGICRGDEQAVIYDSYANIVVKPTSILRGKLAVDDAPLNVEIPWPNNVKLDAPQLAFPAGSRVIVVGEPVREAEAEAAPLVDRGLLKRSDVAVNLVSVPPYGFIVEGAEGVVAPFWDEGPLVEGEAAESFASFDQATAALEAAAPNALERPSRGVRLPLGTSND